MKQICFDHASGVFADNYVLMTKVSTKSLARVNPEEPLKGNPMIEKKKRGKTVSMFI